MKARRLRPTAPLAALLGILLISGATTGYADTTDLYHGDTGLSAPHSYAEDNPLYSERDNSTPISIALNTAQPDQPSGSNDANDKPGGGHGSSLLTPETIGLSLTGVALTVGIISRFAHHSAGVFDEPPIGPPPGDDGGAPIPEVPGLGMLMVTALGCGSLAWRRVRSQKA